jgi:hypothetical protein
MTLPSPGAGPRSVSLLPGCPDSDGNLRELPRTKTNTQDSEEDDEHWDQQRESTLKDSHCTNKLTVSGTISHLSILTRHIL